MEIDFSELQKQRKEEIIKSGNYCKAEIVIGKNDNMPIAQIEVEKISSKEVALLMGTMKEMIVALAKKDPFEFRIFQNMQFDNTTVIEKDLKEERGKDSEADLTEE